MEGTGRSLPASLSVAAPVTGQASDRPASVLPVERGLRPWARDRYMNKSLPDIRQAAMNQSAASSLSLKPWTAWRQHDTASSADAGVKRAQKAAVRHERTHLALPTFDSRPGTGDIWTPSSLLSSFSPSRRRSSDNPAVEPTRKQTRKRSRTGTLLNRLSPSPSERRRQSGDNRQWPLVTEQHEAVRRSPSLHATVIDTGPRIVSMQAQPGPSAYQGQYTSVVAEPESDVSPVDVALFAEAVSSLGFEFSSAPPSPLHATSSFQAQSFPPPRVTSVTTAPRLSSLRPSTSQRSRSAPPRRAPFANAAQHSSSSSISSTANLPAPPRNSLMMDLFGSEDHTMQDDELPDYETSQAEAHEARREYATRRARELEQTWQRLHPHYKPRGRRR